MDSLSVKIKYYKRLIKDKPNDKRTEVRKYKLMVLREQKKIKNRLNKVVTRKTKRLLRQRYTQLNKLFKNIKPTLDELKKQNKVQPIEIYEAPQDVRNLRELYSDLFSDDKLAKGLRKAFELSGLVLDADNITDEELIQIDKLFGVNDLSFNDIMRIIDKQFSRDVDAIFYAPDNVMSDDFNGDYFEMSLKEMIDRIRTDKELYNKVM